MTKNKTVQLNDKMLVTMSTLCRKQELYRDPARDMMEQYGPQLIEACCEHYSLRELGRESGLSITYLSMIRTGKCKLSGQACQTLVRILRRARQTSKAKNQTVRKKRGTKR